MRDLTKKQKVLLTDYFNKNKENIRGFQPVDDMPEEIWGKLVEINDTEILYQNCNNFLHDLAMDSIDI